MGKRCGRKWSGRSFENGISRESISNLAREYGLTRNTVRKYVNAEAPPKYDRKRKPTIIAPFADHIRARLAECDLSARRIMEEIEEMGYRGGYTAVKDFMLPIKRDRAVRAEIRFETRPSKQ